MRVQYKKINRDSKVYPTEYKLDNVNFCCDEMREAWNDYAIQFGEKEMLNTNHNVNIFRCSPYPEGAVFTEYEILYCPFCGELIVVEEKH